MKFPGSEGSLWRDAYPPTTLYPSLSQDIEADTVIIGAGITGLTTAYLLMRSGQRVAVIEKDTIGGGTSGRTTGKVTSQHNLIYNSLVERRNEKIARLYGEANQTALNTITKIVKDEKIDCDFQCDDNYVYTTDPKHVKSLRNEAETAALLGLPATYETEVPLPFETKGAVKFSNQAKIHSQKYLLSLAHCIEAGNGLIFEQSNVAGIHDGREPWVRTRQGKVRAKSIVVATNVPTLPLMARGSYCLHEYPMESYIVVGKPSKIISGMYISPDKRQYSILPFTIAGEKHILIGGESHISGLRCSRQSRFKRLADYAERHFGVHEITHYWSDRDYLGYDNTPLVGKAYPWSKNLYLATGFMKWGLTNGTASAMILHDLILKKQNPWAEVFAPQRRSTLAQIPRVAAQHLNIIK